MESHFDLVIPRRPSVRWPVRPIGRSWTYPTLSIVGGSAIPAPAVGPLIRTTATNIKMAPGRIRTDAHRHGRTDRRCRGHLDAATAPSHSCRQITHVLEGGCSGNPSFHHNTQQGRPSSPLFRPSLPARRRCSFAGAPDPPADKKWSPRTRLHFFVRRARSRRGCPLGYGSPVDGG